MVKMLEVLCVTSGTLVGEAIRDDSLASLAIYIYTQLFPSIYVAYTPIAHANLKIANPHAIPKLSHTTFNLLPFTSCHPTGTSTIGMPALSANINISTSKIHPSECICGTINGSAALENSLNPHCVSPILLVAGGVNSLSSR